MIREFAAMPLALPTDAVYRRLGRRRHKTEISPVQRGGFEKMMREAFALCRPRGVCREEPIAWCEEAAVLLASGDRLAGRRAAEFLAGSSGVLLAGVTVGGEVVAAARAAAEAGEGAKAMVYDAVGSETADLAMGWLMRHCAASMRRRGRVLSRLRISPGYGDFALAAQETLARLLELETRLGVCLNECFFMTPEKSVTAIAGIQQEK